MTRFAPTDLQKLLSPHVTLGKSRLETLYLLVHQTRHTRHRLTKMPLKLLSGAVRGTERAVQVNSVVNSNTREQRKIQRNGYGQGENKLGASLNPWPAIPNGYRAAYLPNYRHVGNQLYYD